MGQDDSSFTYCEPMFTFKDARADFLSSRAACILSSVGNAPKRDPSGVLKGSKHAARLTKHEAVK